MQNNDIQKILDRFGSSKVGKAKGPALNSIAIRKLIYQYDFDGNLVKIYKSTMECSKTMNTGATQIQNVINGYDRFTNKKVYSARGFIFREKPTEFTKEELDFIKKNSNSTGGKPEFGQYDLQGNLIKKFKRANLAALEVYGLESVRKSIIRRLEGEVKKPLKGFNWKYIEDAE
jgi:hypothetical protein